MKKTKEELKQMSIVDIAYSLGMELEKVGRYYRWKEHDSLVLNTEKNTFAWYSRGTGGDVIELVQTIKNVSYKEALNFLETGEFKKVEVVERDRKPFVNNLERYEIDFEKGREFLKNVRGISDETIDFFLKQGVLALSNKKAKDGYQEAVIVFKFKDSKGKIEGGSLQGIEANKERYGGKGYLKQIQYNSNGLAGFNVDIGKKVDKIIFFEAPIDLMSYYDLNKEKLDNVKLVAMDGLKEATIKRYMLEQILENKIEITHKNLNENFDFILRRTNFLDKSPEPFKPYTLAVDNDTAGRNFIERLRNKNLNFTVDLPDLQGKEKMDWNDALQERNKNQQINIEKISEDINISEKFYVIPRSVDNESLYNFKLGEKIDYREFIEELYRKNIEKSFSDNYDSIYFDIYRGDDLLEIDNTRYDIGEENLKEYSLKIFPVSNEFLEYDRGIHREVLNNVIKNFNQQKEVSVDKELKQVTKENDKLKQNENILEKEKVEEVEMVEKVEEVEKVEKVEEVEMVEKVEKVEEVEEVEKVEEVEPVEKVEEVEKAEEVEKVEKVEKYVNVEQYKNYLDLAIQGKQINDDKINLVDIYENNKEVIDYISGFKAIKGYLNTLQIKLDFTDNPIKGGGSFYPEENSIYIKKGQSQEEAFKALLESVAHAKLHNEALENNQNYVYNQFEIESIAYMIASHYDVDTSIYTFENITRSIEEKDVYEDFESKLNEIQHEAKEIISKIDTKLAKVKAAKLNKGRPLNPVQERLQAAKNKRIVASEQKTVKKQRTQEEMKR